MDTVNTAIGIMHEARARARYREDWEQDGRANAERAEREETVLAIKAALVAIASLFRRPTLRRVPA